MIYPYLLSDCSYIEYLEILNSDEILRPWWTFPPKCHRILSMLFRCSRAFPGFWYFDRRSSLEIKYVMVIKIFDLLGTTGIGYQWFIMIFALYLKWILGVGAVKMVEWFLVVTVAIVYEIYWKQCNAWTHPV